MACGALGPAGAEGARLLPRGVNAAFDLGGLISLVNHCRLSATSWRGTKPGTPPGVKLCPESMPAIPAPPAAPPARSRFLALASVASQAMVRVTDSLLPQIAADIDVTVGTASIVVTAYCSPTARCS